MKKITAFIMFFIIALALGGCTNTISESKVLNYSYESIVEVKMFSSSYSSSISLTKSNTYKFYNYARQLNFFIDYTLDENESMEYEYYFLIRYTNLFFISEEVFLLNSGIFYNQYNKSTLQTNGNFVNWINTTFENEWNKKVSEF